MRTNSSRAIDGATVPPTIHDATQPAPSAATSESAPVPPPPPPPSPPSPPSPYPMHPDEYQRYGRQMVLPNFGGLDAQLRLRDARVLVVGAGGLGCPAVQYLAAAGVGHLTIVDADVVERSNLARQILHTEARIGVPKAISVQEAVKSINPHVRVEALVERLTSRNALDLARRHDVVVDCTDNPLSRYLASDAAVLASRQVVSGAAQGVEGQLVVLHRQLTPSVAARGCSGISSSWCRAVEADDDVVSAPDRIAAEEEVAEDHRGRWGPCYRCLFPRAPRPEEVTDCEDGGVLGPITGLVGTMQALEAIRLLVGGELFEDAPPHMTLLNPLGFPPFRSVKLRPRRAESCRACGDADRLGPDHRRIRSLLEEDYEAFCGVDLGGRDGDGQRDEGGGGERVPPEVLRSAVSQALRDPAPPPPPPPPLSSAAPDAPTVPKGARDASGRFGAAREVAPSASPSLVVDVRPRVEFGIVHVPASQNVPLDELRRDPAGALARVRKWVRELRRDVGQDETVAQGPTESSGAKSGSGEAKGGGGGFGADDGEEQQRDEERSGAADVVVAVVCRRGNDSRTAVQLLRREAQRRESGGEGGEGEHGDEGSKDDERRGERGLGARPPQRRPRPRPQIRFVDVVGGLRAVSERVDARFPSY